MNVADSSGRLADFTDGPNAESFAKAIEATSVSYQRRVSMSYSRGLFSNAATEKRFKPLRSCNEVRLWT